VIQFLKHKNLRFVFGSLLVTVLLLPYGLKLKHAFEAHSKVVHCGHFSEHLHEKEPHLDLLDFALLYGVEEMEGYSPLNLLPLINLPKDHYTFSYFNKNLFYTVSRGPPAV